MAVVDETKLYWGVSAINENEHESDKKNEAVYLESARSLWGVESTKPQQSPILRQAPQKVGDRRKAEIESPDVSLESRPKRACVEDDVTGKPKPVPLLDSILVETLPKPVESVPKLVPTSPHLHTLL